MKEQLKGIGCVFSFTFAQQVKTKAYRISTVLLAVLFILIPAGAMGLIEFFSNGDIGERIPEPGIVIETEEEEPTEIPDSLLETVYVVDRTEEEAVSFEILNGVMAPGYQKISYRDCSDDLEAAAELANADPVSLILVMDKADGRYQLLVLIPDGSELSEEDVLEFERFLNGGFFAILTEKSGMDTAQAVGVLQKTQELASVKEETESDEDFFDMIVSMILSFFFIMLLYFLVLFYGQGVANSVIVEKTSRLMDTFLVFVKPGAMIFGKVFAIVAASALQFIIWILSLVGGFAAGSMLVKMINPESDMLLLTLFEGLSFFSGMFSVPGIILAILMVLAGFLLYCALAAIGGSLAGKPEDLSSTNMLFTMVLVFSFLGAMYGGGIEGLDMGFGTSAGVWLDWIPFTAILVTPAKIILGDMSLLAGAGSLAVVLLTSGLVLAAAGKIYHMMALFKGNPPNLVKIIRMIKEK